MSSSTAKTPRPEVEWLDALSRPGLSIDGNVISPIPKRWMDRPHAFLSRLARNTTHLPPEASHAYWTYLMTNQNESGYTLSIDDMLERVTDSVEAARDSEELDY